MSRAIAGELPIQNFSFEEDQINGQALTPGQYVYAASGWQDSSPGGENNFTENIAGFSYMGSNHQGMTAGSALWQDIFRPSGERWELEPGVRYSLIVAVGNRPGWTQQNNSTEFKLQVVTGGTVSNGTILGGSATNLAVGEINASSLPPGSFRNFNITYDAGASVLPGSLRILLQCGSSDRAHFDNVHLVAVKPRDLSGGYENSHSQIPTSHQDPVPAWESRPGVRYVIYLDFDGEDIGPMPEWNMGRPLHLAPAGLNVTEMRRAFEIVKEDYWPFNLNITTDHSKYEAALPGSRMRCIITTTDRWLYEEDSRTGAVFGGVAHTGSFPIAGLSKDPSVPCFAFISVWNRGTGEQIQSGADIAQDISHEVGHTLGLEHDGIIAYPPEYRDGNSYFGGFGDQFTSGGNGGVMTWNSRLWGPIMGHGQLISQWNDGTYSGATNNEDDVAVIGSLANGFGYSPDDNTAGDAANAVPISTVNDSFTKNGFIGRTAFGAEDEDWWSINLASDGVLDLRLKPSEPFTHTDPVTQMELNLGIPNLIARVDIFRQNGSFLTGASPSHNFTVPAPGTPQQRLRLADALRVRLIQQLNAGTYYLRITGAGHGDPLLDGYTSYGSMGPYSLDGTILHHPVVTSGSTADLSVGERWQLQLTAAGGPATWSALGLPPGLHVNSAGLLSGVPASPGTFQPVVIATGPGGSGQQSMVITVVESEVIAGAVDTVAPWPPLTWSIDTAAGWFSQSGSSHDGFDAIQASPIQPGGNAWVETTVTGPGRVNYFWKHSAQPIFSAATMLVGGVEQRRIQSNEDWKMESVSVPAGPVPLRWTFSKQTGAVQTGADTAWIDQVYYESPGQMMEDAVEAPPGLPFTRGGDGFWFWEDSLYNTIEGNDDALQSPPLRDGQSAWFETSVTGPGRLIFSWRAHTEPTNDYLVWSTQFPGSSPVERGRRTSNASGGPTSFQPVVTDLPAGQQNIRWAYVKDGSGSGGADAAWVDNISWTPALQPPVVTNPANVNWTVGQLVWYPITATNNPTSYDLTGTLPGGMAYSPADHGIIGLPQRAGVWQVLLSAANSAGTGTRNLSITIEPAYAKWARDNNLNGSNALTNGDPDRDGWTNLLEMALNLNPNVGEAHFTPITLNPTTKRLTATFTRVPSYLDLKYEVQVSDNLKTWTTIASSINGGVMAPSGAFSVSDPGGSAPVTVTVVDNAAPPTTKRRSMRIKITQL